MEKAVGEWSETKDATEQIQCISDEVKCQVEQKTNKKYGTFRAIKYRVLALLGAMHYLIKVHVGCHDYLHVCISQMVLATTPPPEVHYVEEGHHKCDPLIPKGCDSSA